MEILQAFKFELRPDGAQMRAMRCTAGCRRFVMNCALDLQIKNREAGGKYLTYQTLAAKLKEWRAAPETAWLAEAPSQTLQQALMDLDRAYQNFFAGRAAFPTFKNKGASDSFRFPQPSQFTIDESNSRIKVPKLGYIRYRNSRNILGAARNITISGNGGKWYASIQTRRDVADPVPVATSAIGIDVGIARFATLSDGTFHAPLNSFKKHEQRLAKYQRRMSRKVKFSSNWKKARDKVARIHRDIACARKDYLHKFSTTISKNHALVAIEYLQIGNMNRSATGTIEAPGRMVKQKSGLNRSILDQGWGDFGRQLDYKLVWNGGYFIKVPAHHTSQTCPCCGHVDKANRQSQSKFLCTVCWYENNADEVGAINILDRALATLGSYEIQSEGLDTVDASIGRASVAQIACEVNGAVMPSAAGTRRSDVREVSYAQ